MMEHLKLFKELCQKEKRLRDSGKKFGRIDKAYKDQIERLLIDEFSYVLKESLDSSKKRLYRTASEN